MTPRLRGWGLAAILLVVAAVAAIMLWPEQQEERQPESRSERNAVPDIPSYSVPEEKGRIYLGTADRRAAAARGLAPEGVQSILDVDRPMKHGQYVWQADGHTAGKLVIWVDLDRQLVSAYRNGHEIGTSVILYGAEGRDSPVGSFPILDKRADYHSRAYDAPMPYSLWLTNDGVAVHGSDVRWGRATHGCVGVPVAFARRLFAAAKEGDVVRIVRSSRIGPAQQAAPAASGQSAVRS